MKNIGYDPEKTYWDLAGNKSISGKNANRKLESASNKTQEAFILLTIVSQRAKNLNSARKD